MKVKYNFDKDDLYCVECKDLISIGEKYLEVEEDYFDGKLIKEFHPECLPLTEEDY